MEDKRIMIGKKIQDHEEIKKILDISANKNNNLLIFFFTFGLYILISTLNTTDVALLLPKDAFKMPAIDFELELLNFFILGPLLLLLFHFNLLFSHHKHLEKLHTYKNKVDINSIDPSLYSFAFTIGNHGLTGRMINIVLWILLYFLPLLVFLIIYIQFADYHHEYITPLHLGIIIFDLIFIISSIMYNDIFYKSKHADRSPIKINTMLKNVVYIILIFIGTLMASYFYYFFYPIVYKDYDPSYLTNITKEDSLPVWTCKPIRFIRLSEHKHCYPRLVVTEGEMAKISKTALYIPRYLAIDGNMSDDAKEKKLILDYGTRIDLANRNLRYADLQKCILTRADMRSSQLQAANLKGSHLQAADLKNAKLQNATLIGAKLQFALLEHAQMQGASFAGANMRNVHFTESTLSNATMLGAQLQSAQFGGSNAGNVDFRGSKLVGANFYDANLTGTSFHNANITSANFYKAALTAADLSGILFVKGDWTAPSFKETEMFGVNISKEKLQDINLTTKQEQFIFDINVSKEYLTFNARRVKYLDKIIWKIKQNLKTSGKSLEETREELTKLQNILNTSCKYLKNEELKYRDTKSIYYELLTICNY